VELTIRGYGADQGIGQGFTGAVGPPEERAHVWAILPSNARASDDESR